MAQDVLQHRELAGNVGLFLDFFLPYDSRNRESPRQQAQSMLNMAEAIIHEGNAPGVAITFSANQNQSQQIHDSYRRKQWFTEIEGPNQGEVMRHVETLQRDSAQYIGLQGRVRIAPITTVYNDDQDEADINLGVRSDLEKIQSDYLGRGWVVLGWQNQDSVAQGSGRYAIGGGSSLSEEGLNRIRDEDSHRIHATLEDYSERFCLERPTRAEGQVFEAVTTGNDGGPQLAAASVAGANGGVVQQAPRQRPTPTFRPPSASTSQPTESLSTRSPTSRVTIQGGALRSTQTTSSQNPAALAQQLRGHMIATDGRGVFHSFYLPYKDIQTKQSIDPQAQARSFLDMANELINEGGAPGIAITYSANSLQTKKIKETYERDLWNTGTTGRNQAEVIECLENLQSSEKSYEALKGKVHIVPISTLNYSQLTPTEWDKQVDDDLSNIQENYLRRGWVVLGWQNQDTASSTDNPYAVGNGLARGSSRANTPEQAARIQARLKDFAAGYAIQTSATSAPPASGVAHSPRPAAAPTWSARQARPTPSASAASEARSQNPGPRAESDPHQLNRFVEAQDRDGNYRAARAELQAGSKLSHWMWFVFPQLTGLGNSSKAQLYGIQNLAEAREYWTHPTLGPRLRESIQVMLKAEGSAADILGAIDAEKFKSCLTLFLAVEPNNEDLQVALARFYDAERDGTTLKLLGNR